MSEDRNKGRLGIETHVRITSVVNMAEAKIEKSDDGRDVLHAPFKAMKEGQVLNGVRYPGEELAYAAPSMNGRLAPYNHPTDANGHFISAQSPAGLAQGYIGAHVRDCKWNKNSAGVGVGRMEGHFEIDVNVAKKTKGGKYVLDHFYNKKQLATSTALTALMETLPDGQPDGAKYEAYWIIYDHNAFMPEGVEPAASIDEGTGMFAHRNEEMGTGPMMLVHCNAEGDAIDAPAINLPALTGNNASDDEISGFLTTLGNLLRGRSNGGEAANKSEAKMADDNAKGGAVTADDLAAHRKETQEMVNKMGDDLGSKITSAVNEAIKPLLDAANAEEAKEREDLTNKIVAANALSESDCANTPMPALRSIAANAAKTDGEAAPVGKAANGSNADDGPHESKSLMNRLNGKGKEEKSNG